MSELAIETKKCTRCEETKPVEEFYRKGNRFLRGECKICSNKLSKQARIVRKNTQPICEDLKATRTCIQCGMIKPILEYYRDGIGLRKSHCNSCSLSRTNDYYKNNSQLILERQRHRRVAYGSVLREFVRTYKSSRGCIECGNKNPDCLEFHHLIKSTKLNNVSRLVGQSSSIKTILEEINKCKILCSSCHRKITAHERNCYKTPEGQQRLKQSMDPAAPSTGSYRRLPIRLNQLEVIRHLEANPCCICNEKDIIVLEFHHNVGIKNIEIANLVNRGVSVDVLKKEIALCQVLCTNCHRAVTAASRREKSHASDH